MDCIQAQAIISEAVDHSPIDAAVLEAAKEHCRTCPECGAYVRALNDVKRAPLPAPPMDLADRIIEAVRAEARASRSAADVAASAADGAQFGTRVGAPDGTSELPAADAGTQALAGAQPDIAPSVSTRHATPISGGMSVGRSALDRRRTYAWLGAAAVVLVAVGVLGALGVMRLVGGGSRSTSLTTEMASTAPAEPKMAASGQAPEADLTGGQSGAARVPSAASSATAGEYVVLSGIVFQHSGPADLAVDQIPTIGTMRLASSPTQTATMRTVYAKDAAHRIYIADDSQVLQSFDVVTRDYQGITYLLRARDISALGTWPQLPADIQAPTSPDGSPVFTLDSRATSSTPVYHRTGSTAKQGIAIPPNTPAPDPASGNPNWTWWAPR